MYRSSSSFNSGDGIESSTSSKSCPYVNRCFMWVGNSSLKSVWCQSMRVWRYMYQSGFRWRLSVSLSSQPWRSDVSTWWVHFPLHFNSHSSCCQSTSDGHAHHGFGCWRKQTLFTAVTLLTAASTHWSLPHRTPELSGTRSRESTDRIQTLSKHSRSHSDNSNCSLHRMSWLYVVFDWLI